MTEQLTVLAGGVVIGWLLTQFLSRTVGTRYLKEADFKKFKESHDNQCSRCQNRRDLVLIRRMVAELAIKAGVPAHEVAKIISSERESDRP